MNNELAVFTDFINSNRESLAAYLRGQVIKAGAKEYLDGLGNDGIELMGCEAAGMLLDLACALLRRLDPGRDLRSEDVLRQLPETERQRIRLPRSDSYYSIMAYLEQRSGQ
jgi:hypothetical protein